MLDAPSHAYLAYRPGVPLVHAVYQAGEPADAPGPAGVAV
jgi:imidazolonepropionase